MTISTKKAGAYLGIASIQLKKNAVYSAVLGTFVKVAGVYQNVFGSVPTIDVLIYGATLQGIAAAIAAKRNGASVMIISERNDLGGMATSGIQLHDAFGLPQLTRATLPKDSLVNELFSGLAARYGKTQQAMYRDQSYSSESKGTLAVLQAMMTKYGLTFTPDAPLSGVSMITVATGQAIDTATFTGLGTIRAKVFFDGSYTSDLLRACGADYTLGAESAATYSESAQFAGWCITGSQPTNPVDPYVTPGISASGLIKYVTNPALQTAGTAVPGLVQAAGYRLSITTQSGQKVAFPAPANYVASDYELHRRWFIANGSGLTTLDQVMNIQLGYGVINSTTSTSKRDANTSGFISLDFPDAALSAEYATATFTRRMQIETIAKEYTLGYLYFLQNDTSVPLALRTNVATYGLCSDDYTTNGNFPPRMYCRSGIRAIGDSTPVKAGDLTAPNAVTSTAGFNIGYQFDAHIRQHIVSVTGTVIQEGLTPASVTQSAPMARIDTKIMFPKKAQASNLLLSWGGNMTMMAYNTVRLEPPMMVLAETAGTIAAVAAAQGIAVQDVNYAVDVKAKLNLYGDNLAGAILMSADSGWNTGGNTVTLSGYSLTANTTYGVTQIATCALTSGSNFIEFGMNLPTARNYDVQVKYIDSSSVVVRGSITSLVTAGGSAQTPLVINESYTANTCGDWQSCGTFAFTASSPTTNKVRFTHDNTANASNVIAVRFVPA